jgi:hypothetical protein
MSTDIVQDCYWFHTNCVQNMSSFHRQARMPEKFSKLALKYFHSFHSGTRKEFQFYVPNFFIHLMCVISKKYFLSTWKKNKIRKTKTSNEIFSSLQKSFNFRSQSFTGHIPSYWTVDVLMFYMTFTMYMYICIC